MRTTALALVLLLALTQAGCARLRDTPVTAQSQYESYIEVKGVQESYRKTLLGQPNEVMNHYLLSRIDKKSGQVMHAVYVNGIEKHSWRSASDETARELEFIGPGEHHRGRTFDFAAVIPEETLTARRNYGYSVKFKSLDGKSQIVTLSPRQIGAQLDAVAKTRGR